MGLLYCARGSTNYSKEVRNGLAFLHSAGQDYQVTCITDHDLYSGAGFVSRHRRKGTSGDGLAIDVSSSNRLALFRKLEKYASKLHELIYTPAGYSYKDGRKTAPIAASAHYNHIHFSFNQGVYLPVKEEIKVMPRFEPPLNIHAVDALGDPKGGAWVLQDDGAIFAFGGARYPKGGAANGKSYFKSQRAARIEEPNAGEKKAGKWFTIVSTSNHRFSYPE